MICPYCNKDRFIIRKQEVVLSKYTEATAYYCEECKKCIIDIDN